MEIKFKGDLIEGVKEKLSEQEKLIRKILNEVKSSKKETAVRLPVEWEKLEEHLKQIVKEWRGKQVSEIINKFLEEIKNNLREGNNIIFRKHFSLGIMETKERKVANPFIVRQLKNPNLSSREKIKLEAKKIINVSRRKRVRFKISQNLKREIN